MTNPTISKVQETLKYEPERVHVTTDYMVEGSDQGNWNDIWFVSSAYKRHMSHTRTLFRRMMERFRKEVDAFKSQMKDRFEMSDLGLLAYYLGIEVTQTGGEITIKQTGYINKILKETSMMDSNETQIPMDPDTKLVKAEDGNSVDATYYRSLIGSLRYLLHTRPDLSYSVGLLSRFMQDPKDHHLKAVKQVIRYIKGTKKHVKIGIKALGGRM
ncbi:ribonuclease H-like domain, reverse transcriptase, RNA-dependent DNA polymerase [Tanacetum coccineum]